MLLVCEYNINRKQFSLSEFCLTLLSDFVSLSKKTPENVTYSIISD